MHLDSGIVNNDTGTMCGRKQLSNECKTLASGSRVEHHFAPIKYTLDGNKNESGYFYRRKNTASGNRNAKYRVNADANSDMDISHTDMHVCRNYTSNSPQVGLFPRGGCQTENVNGELRGRKQEHNLALHPKIRSYGNKNKTGPSIGDQTHNFGASDIFITHTPQGTAMRYQDYSENKVGFMHILECSDVLMDCRNTGETKDFIDFGFVSQGRLKTFAGLLVEHNKIPDVMTSHFLIRQSSKLNFMGRHIPVQSHLKIDRWCFYLAQYHSQQLPDLLEYGFPLDFSHQLSWPEGASVNDAVLKDTYLGTP